MSIIHTIYTKYIFNNIKLLLVRMIKISGRSLNIKFYLLCSECLWHISENNIRKLIMIFENSRSSRPEVFLGKDVLKICSKFTGEHPHRSALQLY